jgi:hypothetical protein
LYVFSFIFYLIIIYLQRDNAPPKLCALHLYAPSTALNNSVSYDIQKTTTTTAIQQNTNYNHEMKPSTTILTNNNQQISSTPSLSAAHLYATSQPHYNHHFEEPKMREFMLFCCEN